MIAMAFAPIDDRSLVGGLLIGAAVLTMALLLLILRLRRASAHAAPPPPAQAQTQAAPASWFTADTLTGYPAQELAALLPSIDDPPGPHELEAAWICATHGHDVTWLEHHFGLPGPIARTLVAAAQRRTADHEQ
jgi:hypothetical protein